MSSPGAFGVDVPALRHLSRDLTAIVDRLGQLGGAGEGTTGDAVEELCDLDADDVGDDALADAVTAFGKRMQWWVRILATDAEKISAKLTDTASFYQHCEEGITHTLERLAFDVAGDPTQPYHPGVLSEHTITGQATPATDDNGGGHR